MALLLGSLAAAAVVVRPASGGKGELLVVLLSVRRNRSEQRRIVFSGGIRFPLAPAAQGEREKGNEERPAIHPAIF